MSDGTKIEWTEATWNPITGCSVHSPGCTNCYAMKLAGTRLRHHPSREGLTHQSKAGPVWNGVVRLNEQWLDQPLRWRRPRMIFVCAHGDLFHESVPDEWIDRVFAVMALAPQHTFQVLTKRSARMRKYTASFEQRPEAFGRALANVVRGAGLDKQRGIDAIDDMLWPLPNVWLGVSVENQAFANERVPDLLASPAVVRWLSCEPLLGPVDLTMIEIPNERGGIECWDALDLHSIEGEPMPEGSCTATLDWIVVGGESGDGARPMHVDWARSLRDQCGRRATPFFFKQWGNYLPAGQLHGHTGKQWCGPHSLFTTKAYAGRWLDGVKFDGMPV